MTRPARQPHFIVPVGAVARTHADSVLSTPTYKSTSPTSPKWLDEELLESIGPTDPKLVSSLHGAISQIMMSMPLYVFSPDGTDYLRAYERILSTLPDTTALDIVLNETSVEPATRLLEATRPADSWRVFEFGDEVAFTIWAQDAYAIVEEQAASAKTYFVEPFMFRRRADSVIADFVSHASELENSSAPLYFQGGNILVGDDFFLIGADYPQNTLANNLLNFPNGATTREKKDIVAATYCKYLDSTRDLHVPGTIKQVPAQALRLAVDGEALVLEDVNRGTGSQQPIFHIDMFISLMGRNAAGKYIIAVGDPRLAEAALGTSWGELALSTYFDEVAAGLTAKGFEIVRTPLPLAHYDWLDGGTALEADAFIDLARSLYGDEVAAQAMTALDKQGLNKGFVREWYFATSNNVLSQIDGDEKKVWLPEYGFGAFPELAETDRLNREIWEQHGFTAIGLGDFHTFAYNLGAAHCITKYLARS